MSRTCFQWSQSAVAQVSSPSKINPVLDRYSGFKKKRCSTFSVCFRQRVGLLISLQLVNNIQFSVITNTWTCTQICQLISYKRFLECTFIQWRLYTYVSIPCAHRQLPEGTPFMKSPVAKNQMERFSVFLVFSFYIISFRTVTKYR